MKPVLIIDDDPLIREYLRFMLARGGYDVVTLPHGENAADLCAQVQFHAVVTDLFMPNSDGIETVKAVRRVAPALPIIVVTGKAGDWFDSCARAMRAFGASVLLRKPFKSRQLLDALASFDAASRVSGELPADNDAAAPTKTDSQ